ncbi:creatininase family protein [Catenisphaera adipataccumulans]|uniref:Creatinine amidohydrolase n=1 Tax=Catenisphaera adipataccumulans TaxID=700500 RepID=A0A7W8CW74_9FIRM|nr:creatininase family protein [Catenisphaera adipataccumulans]MBB5182461.1 creatinine amidohydrolase [Catenisphaera adipataccumulans]
MMRYHRLTTQEMREADREHVVVLLPLGALEQHGNQAPLGTDWMIANALPDYIEKELAQRASDYPLLVMPAMPIGLSTEHKNFCGTVTFRAETYYHVLYDMCESLAHHGFQNVVLLVCHGGNTAMAQVVSRQIRSEYGTNLYVWNAGAFDDPEVQATISPDNTFDFHGGEMETSMAMAIDASSVKLERAQAGHAANHALQDGIGWIAEDWVTEDGTPIGIGGDPKGATKEKGEIILKASARAVVDRLIQIQEHQ